MNAAQNALGPRYPNRYFDQQWSTTPYRYQNGGLLVNSDATMGEDAPVSTLLYQLIQQKLIDEPTKDDRVCKRPDLIDPISDKCAWLGNTQIHLVGHSYGAKLVTLAGMEAIRRWMLVDNLNFRRAEQKKVCDKTPSPCVEDKSKQDCLLEVTGHRLLGKEVLDTLLGRVSQPALDRVYECSRGFSPIDSLVIFNPAFHPGELSFPVEPLRSAPVDTLKFIPRKAIVYTKNDYANGTLFNIREQILNGQLGQWYHPLTSEFDSLDANAPGSANSPLKFLLYPPFKQLVETGLGAVSLGYGVAYSSLAYAFYTLINVPADFWHHIRTNTLDGLFERPPHESSGFEALGKGIVNALDFFLPVKPTRIYRKADGWGVPLVYSRNETEQGLYRIIRPALGKTGINGLSEGRLPGPNLWGLANFYTAEAAVKSGTSQEHPHAPDVDARVFCEFTSEQRFPSETQKDYSPGELADLREKFYSFDASLVFDTDTPPEGAHSDLRETKPPAKNCYGAIPKGNPLQKRDYTFNFVLNFTKTDFEGTLCKLKSDYCFKGGRGNPRSPVASGP